VKTLFLNPPSFEGYDGGASSRWPATREIESYWYPVWLAYPAGMLPTSRLLDASPHKITPAETIGVAADYDFVVLFTSTAGLENDRGLVAQMKAAKPHIKVAFVGPHAQVRPEECLETPDVDFVVRGEFDHAVVEFANGRPLSTIAGVTYRSGGTLVHNPARPLLDSPTLDALPFATEVFKRDLTIENYSVPFLLHPYVAFYTSRGCPALCTFCLWPQTLSGHAWRVRSSDNVAREVRQALELFPQAKELFFDDDTFNIRKDRVLELCARFKGLKFRWSCTARVQDDEETLAAMADAGARLLIVGFESGDDRILKTIKKGATVAMARRFVRTCKSLGIRIHGDFIIGLPGESKDSIERTIDFAKDLDCETIQVSIAHAYPGTELYEHLRRERITVVRGMTDGHGHQVPHIDYPDLNREAMMAAVNRFYDEYYFRPRVIWRIVREALWDSASRKRLAHEAVEFLRLRAERRQYARRGQPTDSIVRMTR
jgi:hopanoid biosynthesis associated radical SAM protein HpnJ